MRLTAVFLEGFFRGGDLGGEEERKKEEEGREGVDEKREK